MFADFIEGVKGYKMWHPIERKFIVRRDVTFREEEVYMQKEGSSDVSKEITTTRIEVEKPNTPAIEPNPHIELKEEEGKQRNMLEILIHNLI